MEQIELLVSDLDGTLLGDEPSLIEFLDWYALRKHSVRLVYSSGRLLDSIRESIGDYALPEPDAIICGVGTAIYDWTNGNCVAEWPPNTDDWNAELVRLTCAEFGELEEQPRQFSSQYKVSYFGYDLDDAFMRRLECRLLAAGLKATVVYSSNRDLDLLPAGVDKGTAAAFLARRWEMRPERIVVAGDTGNDLAMFHAGFRGIVVANAQPELKALRTPHVYHANAPYAAGVLEGLDYWQRQRGAVRGASHAV